MVTEGESGRVIAGRYRLHEKIGRGGMGVVWRATDELLGRQVAVKELPLDDTLSAAQARLRRDRTLREARAVARLRHPNVIVVHDVVEHDERPYIVMELVDGGTLADHVATHGPVDVREAARIGVALLGALRTAHTAGVLHRDVKPSNVLVGEDGRVVLTDFGVAHVVGASTLTERGTLVGSPEYTAPERMSGGRTGPASDLWSLGALLCAVLTGVSPFHRDSLGGILHAVVSEEFRPPAQAGPLLPVVRGLLERDPDRRLDAARAERMLRAFLDASATGGTVPSAVLEAEARRRSTRGVLMAALLVAATAGAGVSAAALIADWGGGAGEGTPTSPAPRTPPPGAPQPSSSSPAPRPPEPPSGPSANRTVDPSSDPTADPYPSSDPTFDPSSDPSANRSFDPSPGPSAEPFSGRSSRPAGPRTARSSDPAGKRHAAPAADRDAAPAADRHVDPAAGRGARPAIQRSAVPLPALPSDRASARPPDRVPLPSANRASIPSAARSGRAPAPAGQPYASAPRATATVPERAARSYASVYRRSSMP